MFNKVNDIYILPVMLQMFANDNMNTTASEGLSDEMKTFYSKYLIQMAEPELVHEQFGQKENIPKNGGKTIEFRKWHPLPKITTPLQEGVTPDGQPLDMSVLTAQIEQYGGYVMLTDILTLTAIDNVLVQATRALGSQAGRTRDTLVREELVGGTNVQFAEGQVSSREALHYTSEDDNCNLTVDAVRRAVRTLKVANAKRIGGSYVGIIHPDCAYDLMSDPKWVNVKSYSDPQGIYEGEIGRIEGVRFVESSEAKVFKGEGASARDVYATLILAADAYGVTELEGGGLQHIVKQLGSSGTADPLNQRATAGWKCTMAVKRLVEEYMVRIETTSSFNDVVVA